MHALCLALALIPLQESTTPFDAARVLSPSTKTNAAGERLRVQHVEIVEDLDGDGFPDAFGYRFWGDNHNYVTIYGLWNDGQGNLDTYTEAVVLSGTSSYGPGLEMALTRPFSDGTRTLVVQMDMGMHHLEVDATGTIVGEVFMPLSISTDMVLVDVDGDGIEELALAYDEEAKRGFKVLAGDATGGFDLSAPMILDGTPVQQVRALADVGDPTAPRVVAKESTNVLLIGEVGASATVLDTISLGASPLAHLAVGDIDGDGDEDVVAFFKTAYRVLRRTGPSTFVSEPLRIGGPATDLLDVDGDGLVDGLCCGGGGLGDPQGDAYTHDWGSNFRISLNDGTGAFAPAFQIPGLGAEHVAFATDVDLDGDVDLIGGRAIYYARGPITGPVTEPLDVTDIDEAGSFDFDGDGDRDAQVGLADAMVSNADGSFTSQTPWLQTSAGSTFTGPGFPGDFDGDGDVDLLSHVSVGGVLDGLHLFANNGGGGFTDTGPVGLGASLVDLAGNALDDPKESVAGDFDGDGDLDLAIHTLSIPHESTLFWNDGTGSFSAGPVFPGETVVACEDFDGDAWPDLLVCVDLNPDRLAVRLGIDGTTFAAPLLGSHAILDVFTDSFALADWDADGDLDVGLLARVGLLGNWIEAQRLLLNDGSGQLYVSGLDDHFWSGWETSGLSQRFARATDVNGDGFTDLMLWPCERMGSAVAILVRDGNGGFEDPVFQVFHGEGWEAELDLPFVLDDCDGDGDVDVMTDRLFQNTRFHGDAAGLRRQYGTGVAGTGGMIPTLGATGPFRVGSTQTFHMTGGVGAGSAVVTWGLAESNVLNKPLGGLVAYNWPWLHKNRVPYPMSGAPGEAGTGSFSLTLPISSAYAGVSLYYQLYVIDPGAPQYWSHSGGLQIDYR